MAEAGVDMNTLCYIMGHSNYKMIMQVYDHVNLERARNQNFCEQKKTKKTANPIEINVLMGYNDRQYKRKFFGAG